MKFLSFPHIRKLLSKKLSIAIIESNITDRPASRLSAWSRAGLVREKVRPWTLERIYGDGVPVGHAPIHPLPQVTFAPSESKSVPKNSQEMRI
jgi:hypothetical protein